MVSDGISKRNSAHVFAIQGANKGQEHVTVAERGVGSSPCVNMEYGWLLGGGNCIWRHEVFSSDI